MKYIDNASEIYLSLTYVEDYDKEVYILSGGVIVEVVRYASTGKVGVMVSNVNKSKETFFSGSFGNTYENPEYFTAIATTDGKSLLQHWIDQSKII